MWVTHAHFLHVVLVVCEMVLLLQNIQCGAVEFDDVFQHGPVEVGSHQVPPT